MKLAPLPEKSRVSESGNPTPPPTLKFQRGKSCDFIGGVIKNARQSTASESLDFIVPPSYVAAKESQTNFSKRSNALVLAMLTVIRRARLADRIAAPVTSDSFDWA
jgi:hypothetical protein